MRKYTYIELETLAEPKQRELMDSATRNAPIRTIEDEKGKKFFVYNVNDEEVAVDEEWQNYMITALYTFLDMKKNNNTSDFLECFISAIKNHFRKNSVEILLKKLNKEELKQIYIQCAKELKEQGIDLYEYISRQELYDLLSRTETKTPEEKLLQARSLIDLLLELNSEVQAAGGIEKWIDEKKEKERKGPRIYAKIKLLSKIWDDSVKKEERESAGKYLIKLQYSSEELAKDMTEGEISLDRLSIIYEIPSLKRLVKEAMGQIDLRLAILIYATIDDRYILSKMNWNDIKIEELKIQGEKGMLSSVVAKFIVEMDKQGGRTLTQEEIDDIFAEEPDRKERMRAYFTLVQNGLYSDDKMVELFGEKVIEDNQENPYEQNSELDVTVEELLTFFDTKRVLDKMDRYCNPELEGEEKQKADNAKSSFLNFYLALLETSKIKNEENTKQIQVELTEKLMQGIQHGDMISVLIAIELFGKRILNEEHVKEIFCDENQEQLIEMYNDGKIDDNTLVTLYKKRFVEKYIVELIYQDIDSEQLKERIQQMSPEDALLLYCLGIIGQLDNKDLHDINWEDIIQIIPSEQLRSKISVLYKNENIGFDDVNKLKELKVLGAREADSILGQIDLDNIFLYGLTSEDGKGVAGRKNINVGAKKTEGISIEDRDVHLKNLGFEAIVNVYGAPMVIAKGSFAGYRVYKEKKGFEKFGVIIFESETDGSSFVMHKAKAGEFIRSGEGETKLVGSRSDWREKSRTDGSVTARMHTVNWGKNIIETIVDVSSIFKFDDEAERCEYVKAETKRLCEANRDSIEYLRMVKEEQKAVK